MASISQSEFKQISVPLKVVNRYRTTVGRSLLSTVGRSRAIKKTLVLWGQLYRSWAKERFATYSRGGGDWPALSPVTVKRRRKGGGFKAGRRRKTIAISRAGGATNRTIRRGAISILWDTGLLIGALDPVFTSGRGAIEDAIPGGILVGYGGPAKHGADRMSIANIAHAHQSGAGRLPERRIIDEPPSRLQQRMADEMARALGEEWEVAVNAEN